MPHTPHSSWSEQGTTPANQIEEQHASESPPTVYTPQHHLGARTWNCPVPQDLPGPLVAAVATLLLLMVVGSDWTVVNEEQTAAARTTRQVQARVTAFLNCCLAFGSSQYELGWHCIGHQPMCRPHTYMVGRVGLLVLVHPVGQCCLHCHGSLMVRIAVAQPDAIVACITDQSVCFSPLRPGLPVACEKACRRSFSPLVPGPPVVPCGPSVPVLPCGPAVPCKPGKPCPPAKHREVC